MAITKVLHMSADFENVINSHLDNSINYILQEKKLGEANLSAGINCMVSGAYEQMMETKEMFGKTGGRQGAERQKQERFRKLYEEMREKGGELHKKALNLPYGSKYMWEYIDYLDGRMFAPIEKFTIGELTEPFLTYEEFAGQKEKERAEQKKAEKTITEQRSGKNIILEHTEVPEISDKEITERKESIVTAEELSEQDHSYEVPVQRKEKTEEQKKEPTVLDTQVQKKSENSRRAGKKIVTKQDYERMTGKEKAEWLGISESDMDGSISRFKEKMGQIGIRFENTVEMTEAFLEVWENAEKVRLYPNRFEQNYDRSLL